MNVERDIELPFEYSENIVRIMIIIAIIFVLILVFNKLFRKKIMKIMKKPNIPKLKVKYEKKLIHLYNKVASNKMDVRNGYLELSNIVREFVEKVTGVKASSFSMQEAKKQGMEDLSLLMEEYYPPEFAESSTGDILKSIEKSIGVVRRWKQKSQ